MTLLQRGVLNGCAIEAGVVLAGVGIVGALVVAVGRASFFAPALLAIAAVSLASVLVATAAVVIARQVTAERMGVALHLAIYAWTWVLTVLGEPRRRIARRRSARTPRPVQPG